MSELFSLKLIKPPFDSEDDIPRARHAAQDVAEVIGLGTAETTRIVTAVSELAGNVFLYVGECQEPKHSWQKWRSRPNREPGP